MLLGGLAARWVPAVANHAGGQFEGYGRVGAHVHVALAVDGRREAGEVLHVGAKTVQHDHQRVIGVGVVIVRKDDEIVEAFVGYPALFGVHEFRS